MAIHESLNVGRRAGSASDTLGRWVPVAGRIGDAYPWTITADVAHVESGSATIRVEAAPSRVETPVIVLHTFAARSAAIRDTQTVTLSGYLEQGYLRCVANVNGTCTVATREEAAFFNVESERDRLSDGVRLWDQRAEQALRAERDLLDPYRTHRGFGYSLDMAHHAFPGDVRDAIAEQIEHRFQLRALGRSSDPSSKVSMRSTSAVDRNARATVARYGPTVFL